MTTTLSALVADDARQRIEMVAASTGVSPRYFLLERSLDQVTWEQVRGDDSVEWTRFPVSGTTRKLYDVEAYRAVPLYYRGQAVLADGTIEPLSATVGPITITGDGRWWAHPLTLPRFSVAFTARAQPDEVRPIDKGEHWAIGRDDPIITYGARRKARGGLVAYGGDETATDALRFAIEAVETVVVTAPAGSAWGRRYVSVGDVARSRIVDRQWSTFDLVVPWQEVLPPNVPVAGFGASWDEVVANFATWDAVVAFFPTWNDLIGWIP